MITMTIAILKIALKSVKTFARIIDASDRDEGSLVMFNLPCSSRILTSDPLSP